MGWTCVRPPSLVRRAVRRRRRGVAALTRCPIFVSRAAATTATTAAAVVVLAITCLTVSAAVAILGAHATFTVTATVTITATVTVAVTVPAAATAAVAIVVTPATAPAAVAPASTPVAISSTPVTASTPVAISAAPVTAATTAVAAAVLEGRQPAFPGLEGQDPPGLDGGHEIRLSFGAFEQQAQAAAVELPVAARSAAPGRGYAARGGKLLTEQVLVEAGAAQQGEHAVDAVEVDGAVTEVAARQPAGVGVAQHHRATLTGQAPGNLFGFLLLLAAQVEAILDAFLWQHPEPGSPGVDHGPQEDLHALLSKSQQRRVVLWGEASLGDQDNRPYPGTSHGAGQLTCSLGGNVRPRARKVHVNQHLTPLQAACPPVRQTVLPQVCSLCRRGGASYAREGAAASLVRILKLTFQDAAVSY